MSAGGPGRLRDPLVIRPGDVIDRRSQTPFLATWIPFDESPPVLPAPYPLARLRIDEQVVVVNQNVLGVEVVDRHCVHAALDDPAIAHGSPLPVDRAVPPAKDGLQPAPRIRRYSQANGTAE